MQQDLFQDMDFGVTDTKDEQLFDVESFQNIILTSTVKQDEYTDFIGRNFDLHISDTCKVLIPNKFNKDMLPDEWNIGVICGASGSGKSTILKHLCRTLGHRDVLPMPTFDNDKTLISNFDNMSPRDATLLLSQMGLASVPTWIRPYNVLSNGEQYRAQLAKLVADAKDDDIIFVDEYTSVVDRNVAMAMSNALQKYIRRTKKRVVLATCHYDVFEWLRPDWIYDLNKGGALLRGDYLRRERPRIELQVYRTTCDTWERFKKYHYMTAELNEAATCFVFTWNNKLVAFYSILPLPNGSYKNAYRGHRLVVLPDFQGFGIGGKVSEWVGGVLLNNGKTLYCKTVNPAIGIYRQNSPLWHQTGKYMKSEKQEHCEKSYNMMGGLTRPSYCHKYVGGKVQGFDDLVLPVERVRFNNSMRNQLTLTFD